MSLEEARAALAQMERIGADGWCLCVSSSAQSEVESALRKLIADHENALTTIAADVEYIDRIDAEITRLRALIEPPTDDEREAAWRKAIADQVRRNCTPSGDAYQQGGDYLVYAVADWIENPPEWSAFNPPSAGFRRQGPITEAQVEAAARASFEVPNGPGDYTWAEMVVEDPTRADIWREDARAILEAARDAS